MFSLTLDSLVFTTSTYSRRKTVEMLKKDRCLPLTFGFKINYNLISFHKQFPKAFQQMDTNRQLEQ